MTAGVQFYVVTGHWAEDYSPSFDPQAENVRFYSSGDHWAEDYSQSFNFLGIGGLSDATDYYIKAYSSLITSQHQNKPNYLAWVQALLKPLCDIQDVLNSVPYHYSLPNAVGNQLDVLGQWIGISRNLSVPLVGVYLSLDSIGLGLDQGVFYNPDRDSLTAWTQLSDDVYLTILYSKIAYNKWNGSSVVAMQDMIPAVSPYGYSFYIQDNQDGTMLEGLIRGTAAPPVLLQQLLANGLFDFRPAGVQLTYFWQSDSNPIFALDVDNSYFGGADHGSLAIFTPFTI